MGSVGLGVSQGAPCTRPGIPSVEDRIAQMVAKLYLEPKVELIFWAMKKHKQLDGHKRRAQAFLSIIAKKRPMLSPHWSFLPITIE